MILADDGSPFHFLHVDATERWQFCEITVAYDDLFLNGCGLGYGTVHDYCV